MSGPELRGLANNCLADDAASQILEFAIALPLLIVFVVGIFDFGGAFNLKQQLTNAAREGARHGASLPTNDLEVGAANPASINSIRDHVDAYLIGARIADCGLPSASLATTTPLIWTYSATGGGCAGTLTLTIDRGFPYSTTIAGNTINVIATRVTISYPYKWTFNKVIQFLVPGANYAGVTQIPTDAVVPNVN